MTSKRALPPRSGHALIASHYINDPTHQSSRAYLVTLGIFVIFTPPAILLLATPPNYWLAILFSASLSGVYMIKIMLPNRNDRAAYVRDLNNLTLAIDYFELLVPIGRLVDALNSDKDLAPNLHEYHLAWDRLRTQVDMLTFFNARITAMSNGDFDFASNVEKDIAERTRYATPSDVQDVLAAALRRCTANNTLTLPALRATLRELLYAPA